MISVSGMTRQHFKRTLQLVRISLWLYDHCSSAAAELLDECIILILHLWTWDDFWDVASEVGNIFELFSIWAEDFNGANWKWNSQKTLKPNQPVPRLLTGLGECLLYIEIWETLYRAQLLDHAVFGWMRWFGRALVQSDIVLFRSFHASLLHPIPWSNSIYRCHLWRSGCHRNTCVFGRRK
jgi:hypothetical protein